MNAIPTHSKLHPSTFRLDHRRRQVLVTEPPTVTTSTAVVISSKVYIMIPDLSCGVLYGHLTL